MFGQRSSVSGRVPIGQGFVGNTLIRGKVSEWVVYEWEKEVYGVKAMLISYIHIMQTAFTP